MQGGISQKANPSVQDVFKYYRGNYLSLYINLINSNKKAEII
jgi:hypothetical protein